MNTPPTSNPYKRHRFPAEIISHGGWLYFRFCLSYRDVEELMAARGVILTYEAVRYWCRKFGQTYANQLHRRHPIQGADSSVRVMLVSSRAWSTGGCHDDEDHLS
jgi:putative transposase